MKAEDGKRPGIEVFLGPLAVAILVMLCVLVLKPFAPALMWAVVLGLTLYPLQRRCMRWFGGRKSLSAIVVTALAILVVAGPISLIGLSLADDGKRLAGSVREQVLNAPEEAPALIREAPLIGDDLADYWRSFIRNRREWTGKEIAEVRTDADPGRTGDEDPGSVADEMVDGVGRLAMWTAGIIGKGLTQILISLFILFFLLRDGKRLGARVETGLFKIGGERGKRLLLVAKQTVKGVVYGYLGTSAAQAVTAGVGFAIAGVPGVVLLSALTFFLAVIPVGPPLIWGGAAIWLQMQDRTGWAIFMVIWGLLAISSIDNVIRPLLVSQENNMPFALMFLGLIGGAVSFGLIGVFLGPVLLAVAFRMLNEWTMEKRLVEVKNT